MEEIEVMIRARDKNTIKVAVESSILPTDEKLFKKIAATQNLIIEKEEILANFKDFGYDLGGVQNQMLENIHTKFSFANTKNRNTFIELEEDLKQIKDSYKEFQVQKKYSKNQELDERYNMYEPTGANTSKS